MITPQTGKFITVEGIEGVGKSSNITFLKKLFESTGHEVVVTREPGGTKLGEEVRDMLLDHRYDGMSADTELLLMFAARAEHLTQLIWPALKNGKWVLCDRFTDATYAYQGGGRGISLERVAQLEGWVQGEFRPALTLLLDVPVDVGLKRAGQCGKADRFEKEQYDFFQRVRQLYLQRAEDNPQQYRIIDASVSLDQVQSQLKDVIDQWMRN